MADNKEEQFNSKLRDPGLGAEQSVVGHNRAVQNAYDKGLGQDQIVETSSKFNFEEESTTVQDFEQEIVSNTPILPESVRNNEAALGAVLEGRGNLVESFSRLKAELSTGTYSGGIESVREFLDTDDDLGRKALVEDYVTDPSKTPEERAKFLEGYLLRRERQESLLEKFSVKIAESDSEGESRTSDNNRLDAAELISQATEAKRLEQQVYNSYSASLNTDSLPFLVDFAEAVIPFSQQSLVKEVLTKFKNKDLPPEERVGTVKAVVSEVQDFFSTYNNLAGAKEDLISRIDRMPVDERVTMAKALVGIVDTSSGITGFNKNDFEAISLLRELTETGYYGSLEKVVDSVVTVLDVIGLGTPARVAKGGGSFDFNLEGGFDFTSFTDKPFKGGPSGGTDTVVLRDTSEGVKRLESRTIPKTSKTDSEVDAPQPGSPFSSAKDNNPSVARNLFESAMEDTTGSVSKVVAGVGKSSFAHSVTMPKHGKFSDAISEMPSDLYRVARISDQETKDIINFTFKPSGLSYPESEKVAAGVKTYNNLREITGLSPRLNMSSVDTSQGFINTNMVYGATPDTGWSTIKDAIDTVEFNLRPYGVTKADLSILIQDPITHKYIPFKSGEKGLMSYQNTGVIPKSLNNTPGNFLVRLNYKRSFNPSDTDIFGTSAILWRGIDRLTGHMFSADRYLADASTRFQDYIRKGAFRSVDKGFAVQSKLLKILNNKLGKLPPASQARVMDLAKRSNLERTKFTNEKAVLEGLTHKEADALRDWYRYWDTIWEMENRDLVRTLNSDGFMLFKNEGAGVELFVKPISMANASDIKNVYNPISDTVIEVLDPKGIKEIYDNGGMIAVTRRPVSITSEIDEAAGVVQKPLSYVIVRNDTSNVLRGLREDDTALNYIPGYYKVDYGKNTYFIDRVVKDADGEEVVTTIAATGKSGTAKFASKRLDDESPDGVRHEVRRGREVSNILESDSEWDMNVARGRSPQRFRGERLSSVEGGDLVEGEALLVDPVETAHRTAASLSQRVTMRDWIESMKQRWVNDYGEMTGGVFPDKASKIKSKGYMSEDTRVSDAKGLHEYIRFMEQVSNSAVDDGFKSVMLGIAELLEGSSDSLLRSSTAMPFRKGAEIAPLQLMRRSTFQVYLAANPLRQFVLQSFQWTQLMALDPEFVGKDLARQASALLSSVVGGKPNKFQAKLFGVKSEKELQDIINLWEDSGLHQAVDGNTLAEGAQRQILVDRANTVAGRALQTAGRAPGALLDIAKRAGFDSGEYVNLLTGFLFARNKAIKMGMDFNNPETLEEIAVMAREYTYGMNKAGQLKHAEGVLGVLTQFMSVPHKAAFTMLPNGNKAYTGAEKRRVGSFNLLMFGPPAGLFTALVAYVSEVAEEEALDPELTSAIEHGLFDLFINQAMEELTGTPSTLDIEGTFAPGSITPVYDLVQGLLEDPRSAFAFGSLFLAENSRFDRLQTGLRFAWENPENNNAESFAKSLIVGSEFFSGMSNFFKAKAMDVHGKLYSSSGRELPGEVTTPAMVAQLLGITRRDTSQAFVTFKDLQSRKEDIIEDVKKMYEEAKRVTIRRGEAKGQDLYSESIRLFWTVYGDDDPELQRFVREEFAKISANDARTNTEGSLVQAISKASGFTSEVEFNNLVNTSGLSERTRALLKSVNSKRFSKNKEGGQTSFSEDAGRIEPQEESNR